MPCTVPPVRSACWDGLPQAYTWLQFLRCPCTCPGSSGAFPPHLAARIFPLPCPCWERWSQRYYCPFLCLQEVGGRERGLSPALWLSVSLVPKDLVNATSLRVQEGQSLRLICGANGNIPARLSWFRGSLALSPSRASDPGVLELPQVVLGDGGEFTCRAQHPRGFCHVSLNLVVQGEYRQDTCVLRWGSERD